MNDFTKYELDILKDALSIYEKRLYGNESHTRFSSLLRMIGRMIDNYCEHKWIYCITEKRNFIACEKCNIKPNYNEQDLTKPT